MAGGRYHHGDLRAALLDSATDALRTRGADALSLRELARDIGVSHAAPRRHFRDKRALLDALALRGFERLTAELATAAATDGDFRTRVTATAGTYVRFAVQESELLELMFAGKHAPDAPPELIAAGYGLGAAMLEIIADGQRRGHVRPGPVEPIALTTFAAVHGFATLTAAGVLPVDTDGAALDLVITGLLDGLRPR